MWYRKQLGDMVRIAEQYQPGRALSGWPTMKVFSGGTLLETITMAGWPIRMDEESPYLGGFFVGFFFLDDAYSVGTYTVTVLDSSDTHTIQVLPGGNPKGAVIASHYNDLPEANGVIYQRNDGTLERYSNPR